MTCSFSLWAMERYCSHTTIAERSICCQLWKLTVLMDADKVGGSLCVDGTRRLMAIHVGHGIGKFFHEFLMSVADRKYTNSVHNIHVVLEYA